MKSGKRQCAFSQIVNMIRLMLMYYVDFTVFMEDPERVWKEISSTCDNPPPKQKINKSKKNSERAYRKIKFPIFFVKLFGIPCENY